MDLPYLSLFVLSPILGMLVVLCLPGRREELIKYVSVAFSAVPLLIGLYVLFRFRDDGGVHYYENIPWIGGLNVYYKLGMDGISAPMVVLSGLVGFVAVVASWGISKQVKGYFALILLLLAGMNGVFCALDFFLFYVFWELMLLPMYFLIGIWGGPARVYAAIKFFLYTMAGSIFMLVVLLAVWYWSDGNFTKEPERVLAAKEAVYESRLPLLTSIETEEQQFGGQIGYTRLVELFDKYHVDRNGIAVDERDESVRPDLASYVQVLRQIQTAAPGIPRQEALKQLPLEKTFNFMELKTRYPLFLGNITLWKWEVPFTLAMFVFLYIAFAIKVPVFPFHTWLPWAHVEAPTAISVILAGILLKMGVYGFFRLSYPIFPTAAIYFAVPIALFGVFNILYGAGCAMAQTDLKKIVAYSSVSHMGYCMLGLAALTTWGMTGAVLQMFNHGTSTSMLFILVGVIYDRAHHRDVNRFGGLAAQMPLYFGISALAMFASMGLPGLSGFISEILVFLGAFKSPLGEQSVLHVSFQTMTIVAALGVVLTAAYLLWMLQRVFFGPLNEKYKDYLDLSGREKLSLIPLAVAVVAFGIFPQPLINLTQVSVEQTRLHVLAAGKKFAPPAIASWRSEANGPNGTQGPEMSGSPMAKPGPAREEHPDAL